MQGRVALEIAGDLVGKSLTAAFEGARGQGQAAVVKPTSLPVVVPAALTARTRKW